MPSANGLPAHFVGSGHEQRHGLLPSHRSAGVQAERDRRLRYKNRSTHFPRTIRSIGRVPDAVAVSPNGAVAWLKGLIFDPGVASERMDARLHEAGRTRTLDRGHGRNDAIYDLAAAPGRLYWTHGTEARSIPFE